ncbi:MULTISPECIES: dicarboxylate/amino acid:cation symporter [Bradyrhizobium]|jgi:aerobic C4-dicarboxylate transport protein|uniref:C4-dicarboxylate transport protein n=2 Tax=Bradyrhizobium TaxID=374 RepID=A0ABY0P955_9BRAD|nr:MULTISPECIES: dicarboxylate/amino acid:cation symporter [Bradyrhizobium]SDH73338.1 aerobic C4-dicarboxylate transport protein [Bradyrhizobium ottawaense]SEE11111.1 aerobic C4-dicarboxylate transport protein [Bradyrhizobium lablabi]SHM06921.1 aerobic C4-dicarboxylate transport protein [Bradyrhizobium lablabi]
MSRISTDGRPRKPFYAVLYVQVLAAIAVAIALGHFWPAIAVDMKPFGDGFIKLIKMVIALAIFCTVVTGIAGMSDMKKVSRVGGKALLYFEVVSTVALIIGFVAAHVATPGAGFNVDPATLDAKAVALYAGKAKEQTVAEFLLNIIPNTVMDAFARGDILPVVLISILFGCVLSRLGNRAKPIRDMIDAGSMLIFGAINVIMRFAPIGAFGAMAFTVGRYGIASLGPLAKLVGLFYLTSALFVFGILGPIAWWAGFSIWKFLVYIKEEILIVLGTSSSDPVLPSLMEKLERLGCSKPVVGLVVPTGYVFNTDGSSIYMTLAALFVAQATNTDLSISQQIAIFAVAMLTSKGASGVTGASFIALVGTLSVVPTIPVAGMALILGIDRFMSEVRALVNVIGNGVATIVISRTEGELDLARLNAVLDGRMADAEEVQAPAGLVEDNPLPARHQA